ncbi:MAG: hypothetical protein V2I57_11035 [Xanthomonadales bacterium]|jgi:hypothetical protein|nr:hypothetical protein [Xanthomonadales bacterium]
MRRALATVLGLLGMLAAAPALAQGQDSTPGERYLRIVAELLPGTWDNANQHYFDKRRDLPGEARHRRTQVEIEPLVAPHLGAHVFVWRAAHRIGSEAPVRDERLLLLRADGPPEVVSLTLVRVPDSPGDRSFAAWSLRDLEATGSCTWYLRRDAGGFRGEPAPDRCAGSDLANRWLSLSPQDLFLAVPGLVPAEGPDARQSAYWLERARDFHCYADVPGVGGGRDEPFDRYDGIELHDKGGMHWFRTRDADSRQIGLSLQAVTWHVLNENNGNFNRNSLVIYVVEKLADGSVKEHGYAFTDPKAERIGVNLKWMLVNCSLVPRDRARPEL